MSQRSRTCLRLLAACAVVACTHPSINRNNGGGDAGCPAGTERCACLPNNLCAGDLVCGSGLCVHLTGSGGVSGSGGGAPTGAGGGGGATGSGAGGSGGTSGGGTGGGGQPGGPNLIINGDFSSGDSLWGVNNPDLTQGVLNGTYCVSLGVGQFPVLGWPSDVSMAASLVGGRTYQFSYAASSSGPLGLTLIAKVGQAVQPYNTDFATPDTVGSTPQLFFHTFVAPTDDPQAGIAFEMTGVGSGTTSVCFDDVKLVAQ